jgi:ADP-ribose pyrophosphatase YjhB (NUDIX family)
MEAKPVFPPRWLDWAREIQALAQSGNAYAVNEYQRQRYDRLLEISAEIISEHTQLEVQPLIEAFKAQIGYATPRIDVRGAVFQGGKLLLVRESADGGWTMPGGWADVGDVPSESAEREVWEEAGFRVKAQRVVGVYDANRSGPPELYHAFKIVFLCNLISGEARPSIETSEVGFFGREEIPQPYSGERTLERHVRDAFRANAEPAFPTQFD